MSVTNNHFNIKLDDKTDLVLLFVYRKHSLRSIGKLIHKSLGTVQVVVEDLERRGLMERSGRKWVNRTVTDKGLVDLRSKGLIE